jgi:hypothetical protein
MKIQKIKYLISSIVISILISFTACESYQTVAIVVLDSETQQPIDSVFVEFKAGKNDDYTKSGTSGYTDSTGNFIGDFMIGCSFGCYDYFFECSKPGYEMFVSELNLNEAEVLMVKE